VRGQENRVACLSPQQKYLHCQCGMGRALWCKKNQLPSARNCAPPPPRPGNALQLPSDDLNIESNIDLLPCSTNSLWITSCL
jgi:hypothetical protein